MRRIYAGLTVLLCLWMAGASAAQPAGEAAQVQADVKAILGAIYDGDVETVLRFTPSKVIEMQGGAENVRRAVQMVSDQSRRLGMRQESLTFPEPPEFLDGGGRRFAVVRTLQVISANGQRVESLNFQLGVLEPDAKEWVYVEGSRLTKKNIQTLFPGFPADYEFPPFYRKKL